MKCPICGKQDLKVEVNSWNNTFFLRCCIVLVDSCATEQEVIDIIGNKLNVKPENFYINRGESLLCEWNLKLSPTAYEINFTHNID